MKYTNKLNLPDAFVNYVKSDNSHEYNPNRFSVTELLGSTKEIILNRLHREEIEEDISDCVPALMGTAMHNILEQNASHKVWSEASLELKIGDNILSGRVDVLDLLNKTVEDYKTCKVSKVTGNDFEDYRMQGLSYAYMTFKLYDVKIEKLKFYCLMKDWSKIQSATRSGYPATPIYVWEYDISDSDYDYIEKYIKDKLKELQTGQYNDCSESERWYTGDVYAVYKDDNDIKANKCFADEHEANDYLNNKLLGKGHIALRKGESLKCKYYCSVSKWCKEELDGKH